MAAAAKLEVGHPDRHGSWLWEAAVSASASLPPDRRGYLVRWCVAQVFNGHQPVGAAQEDTRARVLALLEEACALHGVDMRAPPGRTLDADEAYGKALEAVVRLDAPLRRAFVRWLMAQLGPEASRVGLVLCLNLRDLGQQRMANESGWDPSQPSRPKKPKARKGKGRRRR